MNVNWIGSGRCLLQVIWELLYVVSTTHLLVHFCIQYHDSMDKSQSLIIMYNNYYYYCTCSIVLGLNRESKKFCFCTNSSIDVEPLRGTLGIEGWHWGGGETYTCTQIHLHNQQTAQSLTIAITLWRKYPTCAFTSTHCAASIIIMVMWHSAQRWSEICSTLIHLTISTRKIVHTRRKYVACSGHSQWSWLWWPTNGCY